jgi:hypothetical protein
MAALEVRAGSRSELQTTGRLLTKVGTLPVVVFGTTTPRLRSRPLPAPGFPLHQGTVEAGLVTCHRTTRFDPVSGCTPTPGRTTPGFDVELRRRRVGTLRPRRPGRHLQTRLRNGARGRHPLSSRSRCSACWKPVVPAEIVRRVSISVRATAGRVGARD